MPTEFVKIVGPDCQNFARSAIWAPVTLSDCLFQEKNVRCGMLSDSHIIALIPDVSRLNFSIVNDQLDISKNKI